VRILLISDVHSNLEAMEASLAAAPAYDRVVNLGDIVGYGASPNEVTERSRSLASLLVRGNHDKACTGLSDLEYFNPVAALAAIWTQQTLSPENLEWLKAMPAGPVPLTEAQNGNGNDAGDNPASVYCVHGSPLDEDEYIITVRDAVEVMMRSSVKLIFFGHTHLQGGFLLGAEGGMAIRPDYKSKGELEKVELRLDRETKYLINPGSIGQPRDGDWRAAFAVFDTDEYTVTYHRVPYDVAGAQKRILQANLPERLATRLKDGR
jgi:predicted phosphodiesterase